MDIDLGWADEIMPPPAPRAPRKRPLNEKLDFDDQSESESASVGEATLRAAQSSRDRSHHSRSGSSGRRRRRHSHSRSSVSLHVPTAPIVQPSHPPPPDDEEEEPAHSASLNMNLGPGAGVYRDRIESEDANPEERSAPPAPAAPPASETALVREAMQRAGVPRGEIIGLTRDNGEQSAEQSESKLKYAVPLNVLYEAGACPVCEESAPALHREAQLRIAGTMAGRATTRSSQSHQEEVAQTIQARTALVKNELRKHELIFKVEAELRTRIGDRRIAVYMLRMRRRIEREMEDAHIHYVRWTMDMLLAHFNVFNEHVRDAVRTAAYTHDLVLKQIPRMAQCLYVPSMTNPGTMLLDVRAARALESFIKLQSFMSDKLTALQNTVDPNALSTLRALTGVINSYSCDDAASAVTCDPEASAGLGAQQQAVTASQNGGVLGPSSAKSIYEINAL